MKANTNDPCIYTDCAEETSTCSERGERVNTSVVPEASLLARDELPCFTFIFKTY